MKRVTWKDFKRAMESAGVKDDDEIESIEVDLGAGPFTAKNLDFQRYPLRNEFSPLYVYSCGDKFEARQSLEDARALDAEDSK